ncbi:hypothetical protein WA026_008164, partial [Henosepilachna vigintioctopunctata]
RKFVRQKYDKAKQPGSAFLITDIFEELSIRRNVLSKTYRALDYASGFYHEQNQLIIGVSSESSTSGFPNMGRTEGQFDCQGGKFENELDTSLTFFDLNHFTFFL